MIRSANGLTVLSSFSLPPAFSVFSQMSETMYSLQYSLIMSYNGLIPDPFLCQLYRKRSLFSHHVSFLYSTLRNMSHSDCKYTCPQCSLKWVFQMTQYNRKAGFPALLHRYCYYFAGINGNSIVSESFLSVSVLSDLSSV